MASSTQRMLNIPLRLRPRKLKGTFGPGSGPEGRIDRLRILTTALLRHERLEAPHLQCDEVRGYVERLIQVAIKHGDQHQRTMDTANYWLYEKDLVHKLFKVLVPRYKTEEYVDKPVTALYRLPSIHRINSRPIHMSVIELKGNPWPPIQKDQKKVDLQLHNVLLTAFREESKDRKPFNTFEVLP